MDILEKFCFYIDSNKIEIQIEMEIFKEFIMKSIWKYTFLLA